MKYLISLQKILSESRYLKYQKQNLKRHNLHGFLTFDCRYVNVHLFEKLEFLLLQTNK